MAGAPQDEAHGARGTLAQVTSADQPDIPKRPSRLRIGLQVAGFVVGCALVAWCAQRAFSEGSAGLEKLRTADPTLIAVLLLSTLGSIVCSGYTFWAVALPIRRFRVLDMQAVNLMASLFNYAPVRLGLFLRCAFHWRRDGMSASELGAWIAGVAVVTLGTLMAGLAAGLAQIAAGREVPLLDWLWLLAFAATIAIGCAVTVAIGRIPPLTRFLKGAERALTDPRALGGGVFFRSIDVAMWSLRMWAAAQIVGVSLNPAQAALLASVAILGAGNPLGRIGWREALVALIAPAVLSGSGSAEEIEALTAQLALLESAGEAALTIPLGILGTIWCVRTLRRGERAPRSALGEKAT